MKHMIRYISCVGLGLTLGLSISLSSQENAKSYRSDFDYPLLQDVLETVETYYVKTVSKEELVEAAIKGIFEHLDPYSSFLNHQELLDLKDSNRGEYFGFGFEVATQNDHINIIAPLRPFPSRTSGNTRRRHYC